METCELGCTGGGLATEEIIDNDIVDEQSS